MSSLSIKKYTSKIIRTPALLKDTKIFLSNWVEGLSTNDNTRRAVESNLFGQPARSYVKQFLGAFKERYTFGDDRDEALRYLVRKGRDERVVNGVLYYHTAMADALLYDFVADYLFERYSLGNSYIMTDDVELYIRKLATEGKTTTYWSDNVCNRVACNILTTLRDFLILEGKVKKRIAPVHLPIPAFVYIAFSLRKTVQAGEKILQHRDWRLFLLDAPAVERLFLEAHLQKFLNYQTVGKMVHRLPLRITHGGCGCHRFLTVSLCWRRISRPRPSGSAPITICLLPFSAMIPKTSST